MGWWMAAAAAASFVAGASEGVGNAKQLGRQAALDEIEARGIEKEAQETAVRIYGKAAAVKGQQVAQLAASGVVVGDGSAQAVLDETDKLSRIDAMAAVMTGTRQASAKRAGRDARLAGAEDAVLSGIVGGGAIAISMYGGSK